jgi:hypothetical protein
MNVEVGDNPLNPSKVYREGVNECIKDCVTKNLACDTKMISISESREEVMPH